jgi:hypothetical protein
MTTVLHTYGPAGGWPISVIRFSTPFRVGRPLHTTQCRIPAETNISESALRLRACILNEAELGHSCGRQGPFSTLIIGQPMQPMDASINREILRSCNELCNILHNLELHVAPADLTGKHLLAVARDRLTAISSAAQHDLPGAGTAQG